MSKNRNKLILKSLSFLIIGLLIGAAITYSINFISTPMEPITITKTQPITVSTTRSIKIPITVTTTFFTESEPDLLEYSISTSEIIQEVFNIAYELEDKSNAYGKLKISKSEYLSYIIDSQHKTEKLIDKIIELKPPQELTRAHINFTKGLNLFYSALILLEDGIIQNNSVIIEEGNTLVRMASSEIKKGVELVESKGRESRPTQIPGSIEEWTTIHTYVGIDSKTTENFYVPTDYWRIKYTVRTHSEEYGRFSFYVYSTKEKSYIDRISFHQTGVEDSYLRVGPGDFYLDVFAANLRSYIIEIQIQK